MRTSGRRVAPPVLHEAQAGREWFQLPLARGLPPGLYLVRASGGRREVSARFVVVR